MSTIAERVAAGAKFLDEHDPDWWRADADRAIDLDELDLGNGDKCILGRRCPLEVLEAAAQDNTCGTPYTWWSAALSGRDDWLGADEWAAGYGFQLAENDPDGLRQYDRLTAEWRRVIDARRAS